MHPSDEAVLNETRRQFFAQGARGLGLAALATMLGKEMTGAPTPNVQAVGGQAVDQVGQRGSGGQRREQSEHQQGSCTDLRPGTDVGEDVRVLVAEVGQRLLEAAKTRPAWRCRTRRRAPPMSW